MPIQLIYNGNTTKCLPRFKFPENFSLSYNEMHYSDQNKAYTFIEEILQLYISNMIKCKNLPVDQKSLVIMNVFKSQVTPMMSSFYRECSIEVVCVFIDFFINLIYVDKKLLK